MALVWQASALPCLAPRLRPLRARSTGRPIAKSPDRLAASSARNLGSALLQGQPPTRSFIARPNPTARRLPCPGLSSFRQERRRPAVGLLSPGRIRPPELSRIALRHSRYSCFSKWREAGGSCENGYAIAATDYPGLGTPGPHPYLVGDSEARAVIDSVRAARSFPGLENSDPLCGLGSFPGRPGRSVYRVDCEILRAGAATCRRRCCSAGNRSRRADDGRSQYRRRPQSDGDDNLVVGQSFRRTHTDVVEPAAMPVVDALANQCIEGAFDLYVREKMSAPLAKIFLVCEKSRDHRTVEFAAGAKHRG